MSQTVGEIFRSKLESLGVEEVRLKLSRREFRGFETEFAESWLAHEDDKSSRAAAARSEFREEENLSISRKALRNSERATRIAISAIMLSISMAILTIIQWHSK